MDNHPIPQDVTGFQFKLLGNMTVKQFAYLATGIVFAVILLQLPINILIKFPFCAFFAIFGAGLAFFPVSGRPMDLMIGNYIKALIRPTQFVYEKVGGQIYFPNKMPLATTRDTKQYKNDFNPFPKDKLKAYLESLDTKPKSKVDEKENNFLLSVSSLAASSSTSQLDSVQNFNTPQPSLQVNPIMREPMRREQTETIIAPQPIAITQPIPPTAPLAKPQATQQPAVKEEVSTALPMQNEFKKPIGIPIAPESPNLIIGITKDARGNALSNILVEVKDRDGNPVRAFKTNELGRFASATPLTNGIYAIEFEDPKAQNRFEKMTINVIGKIILPIEAISIDTREELRRSLFSAGKPTN
ncbi:MAG: PrgI family protein [Candidatus Levybacteria bacterium]|nr:PrgI family protein [Candidatus Levybacteria bacterium]